VRYHIDYKNMRNFEVFFTLCAIYTFSGLEGSLHCILTILHCVAKTLPPFIFE